MIRVLIVDDSAAVRRFLKRELEKEPEIQICGEAPDAYVARDLIVNRSPDVVILDVEMPRMDGLTFLKKIMAHHPLPVIIMSSVTPKGSDAALTALQGGALEVICKPCLTYRVKDMMLDLHQAITAAVHVGSQWSGPSVRTQTPTSVGPLKKPARNILAIGASTGGPIALETILCSLPPNGPGTIIAQHMPAMFTPSLARRLDRMSCMRIREARDGDELMPGLALLAPGDTHLVLGKTSSGYRVSVAPGARVRHHRPSVDVMFKSVAKVAGSNAVGVILTGMGDDGADGLLEMRQAGARTIAQSKETCLIPGMPGQAVQRGAAEEILDLTAIPARIIELTIATQSHGAGMGASDA